MKNKKINFMVGFILILTLLLSTIGFGLVDKQDGHITRIGQGMQVDWEHTYNSLDRQEYYLTVNSATSQKLDAVVYLSEYSKGIETLETQDFKTYLVNELITTEYKNIWCTDSSETDCVIGDQPNNGTKSYSFYGGQDVKEIISEELIELPQNNIRLDETGNEYLAYDLLEIQLQKDKDKKFKIVFEPLEKLEVGDYGVFSVLVDGREYWDKTHSSDFVATDTSLYYSFDDVDLSGSNPLDLTPNNNDGTNNGATTGVTGILNESFSFDGSSDYLDLNYQFSGNTYSINGWFKTTATSGYMFNSRATGGTNHYVRIYFDGCDAGEVNFEIWDGSSKSFCTTLTYNDDNWHSFSMSIDDTNNVVKGYIDSVEVGSITDTFSLNHDAGSIMVGRAQWVSTAFWSGEIDELSIFNTVFTQNDVDFLYNLGAPTSEQQYPYTPIVVDTPQVNTSLQVFHDDLLGLTLQNANYQDFYSLTEDFADSSYTFTIPINFEKTQGVTPNDIYVQTLVDGVPTDEELVVTLNTVGNKRVGYYNTNLLLNGTQTVDFQIRRTGSGKIDINTIGINLYTGFTTNGILFNAAVNPINSVNVIGDSTFKTIETFNLPFTPTNNTYLQFVGYVQNTISNNSNNITIKFDNGIESSQSVIRTTSGDTGSVFVTDMMYTNSSTYTLQALGNENFNIVGDWYVLDLTDSVGEVIGSHENGLINETMSIIPISDALFGGSFVSFLSSNGDEIEFNQYAYDVNTTINDSTPIMYRNFDSASYGVFGDLHSFDEVVTNNTYTVGTVLDLVVGTGTIETFNQIILQGTSINYSADTSGNVVVTIEQTNGSYIGALTGSCIADNLVQSLIINDSDFVFSGSVDDFTFTYTGIDKPFVAVEISCVDQYLNTGSAFGNFAIDTTKPVCTGITDESLTIGLNQTEVNYTWSVSCTDNIGLASFDVSCDNGFTDSSVLTGLSDSYGETTAFNETTSCSYTVKDTPNNEQGYSSTFTIGVTEPETPIESGFFDVNSKLTAFSCPTNHIQLGLLFGMYIIVFVIFGTGLAINNMFKPILITTAGFCAIILPFFFVGCDMILAMMLWVIGLAMLFSAAVVKFE